MVYMSVPKTWNVDAIWCMMPLESAALGEQVYDITAVHMEPLQDEDV